MPSAEVRDEGTVSVTFNRNDIWKIGTLSVSPFNWLEASYFYYRPSDLKWDGTGKPGDYLDKGFNVKFIYQPKNKYMPNLAIGLDDFAGTGFFTREYIVSTTNINKSKFTLGLGWGKFVGDDSFKNPFQGLSERFKTRPNVSKDLGFGGTPSYNLWFRGDAAIFGGFEYSVPKISNLKFKIEYDPFNYFDLSANNRPDASIELRQKNSDFNYGFSYPINKYMTIDASYIKGNTFNLNFTIALTFNDRLSSKPDFRPEIVKKSPVTKNKKIFYEDLLENLNNNRLFLQTASLTDKKLDIAISTSDHRNSIRSSSYASHIAKHVADLNEIDLSIINISNINAGIELNNISYISSHLKEDFKTPIEIIKYYTELDSGDPKGYEENEFKPKIEFPVIFSSIAPTIVSHIGNPEKVYYGGLVLQHISEVQFKRNLLFTTELNYSIYQNFEDTISGPGSNMTHVRTDIVQYLKEDDLRIKRMQLDYIWSPKKNFYSKITGGIFESMYGGIGGEFLYKPFNKNYLIGFDLFYVKQRTFEQRFSFRDYKTSTGHINFGYLLPLGIEANLSIGRYLAKDDGYTLDLSRKTSSGFQAGIYFTRTDVPASLFGEGSFDKGFYFQFPMDLLSGEYKGNYSSFKLSPLTRDGGAKLIHDKDLRGLIYNSNLYELNNQWNGFLN